MPFYKIHVEKFMSSRAEYWLNVYRVEAADLQAASAIGDSIVNAEKPLYPDTITITKQRAEATAVGDKSFRTKAVNAVGTRPGTGLTTGMPLFAVGRVDFSVADNGRPCRKYIRGIYEEDSEGLNLSTAYKALLQTYATAIAGLATCDPQGNDLTDGAPHPGVAMRQLRRGSKKKITP